MRLLTAQVELSARPRSAAADEGPSGYSNADHGGSEIDLTEDDRAEYRQAEQHLEAAKRAAIEPSALLRGRRRRR